MTTSSDNDINALIAGAGAGYVGDRGELRSLAAAAAFAIGNEPWRLSVFWSPGGQRGAGGVARWTALTGTTAICVTSEFSDRWYSKFGPAKVAIGDVTTTVQSLRAFDTLELRTSGWIWRPDADAGEQAGDSHRATVWGPADRFRRCSHRRRGLPRILPCALNALAARQSTGRQPTNGFNPGLQGSKYVRFVWSRLGDLNPGPTHYEPFATPLESRSYSCILRLTPACSAVPAPCSGAYPGHLAPPGGRPA